MVHKWPVRTLNNEALDQKSILVTLPTHQPILCLYSCSFELCWSTRLLIVMISHTNQRNLRPHFGRSATEVTERAPSNLRLQQEQPKHARRGAGRCPTGVGLLAKFAGWCGGGDGDEGYGSNLLFQQPKSNSRQSKPAGERINLFFVCLLLGTVMYMASTVYLKLTFNEEVGTPNSYETMYLLV